MLDCHPTVSQPSQAGLRVLRDGTASSAVDGRPEPVEPPQLDIERAAMHDAHTCTAVLYIYSTAVAILPPGSIDSSSTIYSMNF